MIEKPFGRLDRAAERADTMPAVAVLVERERVADREHRVADRDRVRVAERDRLELGPVDVDLEHGDVRLEGSVPTTFGRARCCPSLNIHRTPCRGLADDVVVGEDVALVVDDHAARAARAAGPSS